MCPIRRAWRYLVAGEMRHKKLSQGLPTEKLTIRTSRFWPAEVYMLASIYCHAPGHYADGPLRMLGALLGRRTTSKVDTSLVQLSVHNVYLHTIAYCNITDIYCIVVQ